MITLLITLATLGTAPAFLRSGEPCNDVCIAYTCGKDSKAATGEACVCAKWARSRPPSKPHGPKREEPEFELPKDEAGR